MTTVRTAPIRTIVVGYDGTRPAEHALLRAAQLAQAFGARVIVADVAGLEPLQGTPGAFGLTPYYGFDAERTLQHDEVLWQRHRDRVESFFAEIQVPHEFAGRVGEPVEEIVEIAERRSADLIVVGTHEPGLLERLIAGSVSQGVARRAHCDVLVVHPPDGSDSHG